MDLVFPPQCAACGAGGAWLCAACSARFRRLEPPFCARCTQPLLLAESAAPETSAPLCARCARAPLALESISAPFLMEGPVREMVHRLKYDGWRVLAGILAKALAESLARSGQRPDVLAPVPLHLSRERERGYNQASLLAHELSNLARIPVARRALLRVRPTPPQVDAPNAAAREAAVAGAFRCNDPTMRGRSVMLVDDVCTTGATLNACAVPLLAAGVAEVRGLVVAR
ncbi:MAG: ComF family protein [Dehalococcoidia bacterium]|nr:ComF family protein [Dehalococcoidia bacterium]